MPLERGVITVLGLKGGVGKTTVAVNLAVSIARTYPARRVALLDGHLLRGDVGVFLNARPAHTILHLLEQPPEEYPNLLEQVMVQDSSGVRLLLSPPSEFGVLPPDLGQPLFALIDAVAQQHDYVVIDTPPAASLTPDLAACVQAADLLVLVAEPTIPALKDTRTLLNYLTAEGWPAERMLLVLNRVSRRTTVKPDQIEHFLRHPLAAEVPDDPALFESANRGVPHVLSGFRAPGAAPFYTLAALAAQESTGTAPAAPPHPPARRLEPAPEPEPQPARADRPPRVLVIHPNPDRLLSTLGDQPGLELAGISRSDEEALAWLAEESADLALIGHPLLGGSGVDLIRTLRAIYPDLASILMAEEASSDLLREALRAGAADLLVAPYSPEEVSAVILRASGGLAAAREEPRAAPTFAAAPPAGPGSARTWQFSAATLAYQEGRVPLAVPPPADLPEEGGVMARRGGGLLGRIDRGPRRAAPPAPQAPARAQMPPDLDSTSTGSAGMFPPEPAEQLDEFMPYTPPPAPAPAAAPSPGPAQPEPEQGAAQPLEEGAGVGAEQVNFTAYHPRDVGAEAWYTLLFYTHLADVFEQVQRDAARFADEMAGDPREVKARTTARLRRGTDLRIVPEGRGLTFKPAEAVLTWDEDMERALFRFKASGEMVNEPVLGEISVYVGPLEIATVRFSVFVTEGDRAEAHVPLVESSASMYQRIFASYSHQDTPVVDTVVETLKVVGFDVLIDRETLQAGRDWSRQLEELIDQADIFQLFWSENSARSEYVRREWEYALLQSVRLGKGTGESPGAGFIRPVYWQEPLAPVPGALRHLHFKFLPALAAARPEE